jgi:tol-pal system protein YbgF
MTKMSKRLILGSLVALAMLGAPAHAGLFGETDEEKAARLHEQNQDATIADLTQRVHDLEDSLRQTTGQNEALSHQVQQLSDKLERQRKDFEYRLCTVAAQQLGATQSESEEQPALPCGGGSGQPAAQSFNPPPQQQQQQTAAAPRLASPPGSLGTLPAKQANAAPPPANPQAKAQFNAALDMAAKARYDDARAAFQAFADANPGDALTPQAVYWVGDIAFLQKDYAGAAHAFAEELRKYPTSTRAPDSMFKLGQSFLALGQTKEGCLTLGALPGKYPAATKTVLAQAASERKASCR